MLTIVLLLRRQSDKYRELYWHACKAVVPVESAKQLNTGTSASQVAQQMYLNNHESRYLCVLYTLYLLDSNQAKQLIVEIPASHIAKQMYLNKLKSRCTSVLCALCVLHSSFCISLSR